MKQGSRERINLDNLCCPKWEWHVTLLYLISGITHAQKIEDEHIIIIHHCFVLTTTIICIKLKWYFIAP